MALVHGNQPSWDDLRVILAIGREGSLSAAARALGCSHTTVFRQINNIEQRYATRFFNRAPNGYELTEAGELAMRPRTMIRAGDTLFVGGMTNEFDPNDPAAPKNAEYHGLGQGLLDVISAIDGQTLARLKLESPPVWDGMAALEGRLPYVDRMRLDVRVERGNQTILQRRVLNDGAPARGQAGEDKSGDQKVGCQLGAL